MLKGGMLLAALETRRPTVDADLLATKLANTEDAVVSRIVEIAGLAPSPEDGVDYLVDTVRTSPTRESDLYSGVRVSMDTRIGSAVVKLQLDINFGDPVTPAPQMITYPTLRADHPPLSVFGYPLVTVLAEKISTAINLGSSNSRVRDYADIWSLIRRHDLDGAELRVALEATGRHRSVQLKPLSATVGDLAFVRSSAFAAYRRRLGRDADPLPFEFGTVVSGVIDLPTHSFPTALSWIGNGEPRLAPG